VNRRGCGNDGLWIARKTRSGFSLTTHEPLEIAYTAIPTFPQPRLATAGEKWKSKGRIPTFPQRFPSCQIEKNNKETPGKSGPASTPGCDSEAPVPLSAVRPSPRPAGNLITGRACVRQGAGADAPANPKNTNYERRVNPGLIPLCSGSSLD